MPLKHFFDFLIVFVGIWSKFGRVRTTIKILQEKQKTFTVIEFEKSFLEEKWKRSYLVIIFNDFKMHFFMFEVHRKIQKCLKMIFLPSCHSQLVKRIFFLMF